MLQSTIKKIYSYFKDNGYITLFFSFVFLVFILYIFDIGCPIKFVTGISCPGCGLTRSVGCLIHNDIPMALHYHPLIFLIPVIGILFLLKDKINKNVFNFILILITTIFLIVYFIRLSDPNNDIVYIDFKKSIFYKIVSHIKQ